MTLPPFLQAQHDYATGAPYANPHADTGQPFDARDNYAAGWRTAKWRAEFDKQRKET